LADELESREMRRGDVWMRAAAKSPRLGTEWNIIDPRSDKRHFLQELLSTVPSNPQTQTHADA